MLNKIKYLGHIFSEEKIQPDKSRITAIDNYDQPKNKKRLAKIFRINKLSLQF